MTASDGPAIEASFQENRPIERQSRNGTTFRAARADLVGGVDADVPTKLTQELLDADCTEFESWYRANISSDLGGARYNVRIHRV